MSSIAQDEQLAMFFDENFSASSYLDALFSSIAGPEKHSPATLATLASRLHDLAARLEYNSTELANELAKNTSLIRKLSQSVVATGVSDDPSVGLDILRLQHYIDLLRNSVETLHDDVKKVRTEIHDVDSEDAGAVDILIQLKTVRENIGEVLLVLQNARKVLAGGKEGAAVGVEEFQKSLNLLAETLRAQSAEADEEKLADLAATITDMKLWQPMFQPFSHFGPIYSRFIAGLEK